jgi:hypothetical protein
MRATVCMAPSFLPVRQQTMFISSLVVAAMSKSAWPTPACISTFVPAPQGNEAGIFHPGHLLKAARRQRLCLPGPHARFDRADRL